MSRLLTYDETGQLIQLVRSRLSRSMERTGLALELTDIEQKLLQHLNTEAIQRPSEKDMIPLDRAAGRDFVDALRRAPLRKSIAMIVAAADGRASCWREAIGKEVELDASICEADDAERELMADMIDGAVSYVTTQVLK